MKIFYYFLLFFTVNISAQNNFEYFRFIYPDYIPHTVDTEIASICRFDDVDYDEIEILINTDFNVSLNGIQINSLKINQNLTCKKLDDHNLDGNLYSIILEKDLLVDKTIQLIYNLSFVRFDETYINFIIYYLKNGEIVKELSSFDEERYKPVHIASYTPQKSAPGKSIVLKNGEYLRSEIKRDDYKNLVIDFWGKFNDVSDFLKLKTQFNDIITLTKNHFGMLELNTDKEATVFESTFLSKEAWNHFCVFYNDEINTLKIYVNDQLNFEIPVALSENIIFELFNPDDEFVIDLLRIWNWQEEIDLLFDNKNFKSFTGLNSVLLFRDDFDDNQFGRNHKLIDSDAPIFSEAPELNISGYSNFYVLEWKSAESVLVDKFILEKSVDGRNFDEVYRIDQFEDDENIYSYTDVKNPNDKLVYYRVKQINADGSIAYSSQLKIGQKKKKNFLLKQNFPNPFNPTTKITLQILEETDIQIMVYNIVGVKVQRIYRGSLAQGEHSYDFDGSELPSGIYLLEIKTPESSEVMKMILAK